MKFGFCAGSYQSQSLAVDAQRTVNFYLEKDESGLGKSPAAMYGTPGTFQFCDLGGTSVRGLIAIASSPTAVTRVFGVSSMSFYEIFDDGTKILRNPVDPFLGTGIAQMAASPTQILIIDGGQGYCYNLTTNTFQPLQTYTPGLGEISAPLAIVNPGQRYTVTDIVEPSVGGSGASIRIDAVSPQSGGGIVAESISNSGSGYIVGDTVVPTQFGASGAFLTVTSIHAGPQGEITAANIRFQGHEYTVNDVVNVVQGAASGGQVKVTAIAGPTGGNLTLANPDPLNPGSFYVVGDTLTLTSTTGSGGVLSVTAVDPLSGAVRGLSITNAGAGYISGETIVADGGSGFGLQVTVDATPYTSGAVFSIALIAAGSGYTTTTTTGAATTGGTGSGLVLNLTATTDMPGAVTGLAITNAGSLYASAVNLPTTGGTGGGLHVNISCLPISGGGVTAVTLVAGGTGYVPISGPPGMAMFGGTGSGLTMDYATTSLTPGSGMISNPIQCGYSDGFFIVLQGNSQVIQVSQLGDASAWDPTQVAQVSVFSDNIVGMLVDHRQIWLWGSKQSQVYGDSGNIFPFDPIQPAIIEDGMVAALSAVRADNSVFWIGQNERGQGIARRANGYTPIRVSTFAVEWDWAQYPTISDAISYASEYLGHTVWHIYFPTANKSWDYDCSNGQWTERTSFNPTLFTYEAEHSQCHAYANGRQLVGDWQSGNVYELKASAFDEVGQPIQRIRDTPYIFSEAQIINHAFVQLDVEVGLGPQPPLVDGNGDPRQPQLSVQWSDDQGKTWSNEHVLDCGFEGEFKKRVILRRLGRSRGRVYRITCTDPIPWRFADAYLSAS